MTIIINPKTQEALDLALQVKKLNHRIGYLEERLFFARINNDVTACRFLEEDKKNAEEKRENLLETLKKI